MSPKCCHVNCDADGEVALELIVFASDDNNGVQSFINIATCKKHMLTNDEIKVLLIGNWEMICMGFDRLRRERPILEKTLWRWVPWEEAQKFWKEMESSEGEVHRERLH